MRRKIQKYLSGEREGFSLIELIIVIAIMAILIGVVALVVLPYLESSRESTDRAALNEVATAFKSAASVNSKYATEVNKMTTATASASLNADLKKKIESYLEKSLAETEKGLSSKKSNTDLIIEQSVSLPERPYLPPTIKGFIFFS